MYSCLSKKRIIIFISILVVVTTIISTFCIKSFNAQSLKEQENTIILDAGHGGFDPGAVGINGVKEKDINLNIVLCLKDMLELNGYKVILTRDKDQAVVNTEETKETSGLKTTDLRNRLKLFDKYPNALVISIHQNKYPSEYVNGAQMFYGGNNENSKILAGVLQDEFKNNLQKENNRVIKKITKDVFIIYNAKNTAVLVESGFVSNSTECKNLSNEEYQQKIAFTVYCGIIKYEKMKNGGTENVKK